MAGVREERMDWNGIMKNTLMADPAKIVMDLCVVCHVPTLYYGFIIEPFLGISCVDFRDVFMV